MTEWTDERHASAREWVVGEFLSQVGREFTGALDEIERLQGELVEAKNSWNYERDKALAGIEAISNILENIDHDTS